MAKLDIGGFITDTKGSNKAVEKFDLKGKGKAIIFLHPKSGIFKRDAHWFPVYGEVIEDSKKVHRVYNTCIVHEDAKNCLICQLRKALRDNEDIDDDEVILTVGEGENSVDYNKGEITGVEGYGWKKNISYKTEYLFGVVDTAEPNKVLSFSAVKSLGKKITKTIEDQIEEEGEEEGNPFKNPYAFKLTYDKSAQSSDMYDSKWNKFPINDDIQEQLDSEGVNNEQFTVITAESKVAYIIKQSLVYSSDELELDLSAADDFDPKELNRTEKNNTEEKDKEKSKEKAIKEPVKTSKEVSKNSKEVSKNSKISKTSKAVEEKEEEKEEEKVEPAKTIKTKMSKTAKKTIKPQINCPECDKLMDEDANICPHCKAEFEDFVECSSCGKDVPSDSTICPNCDQKVAPF